MSITTYSELVQAIANFSERGDLALQIPTFIALAEARLNRSLYHPGMEERDYATVSLTSAEPQYISLPDNFQSMRRLYLPDETGSPVLDYISESQLAHELIRWTSTAQPRYYTIFGSELQLCPTPDAAYRIEMVFRTNLDPLNSTTTTNWLLDLAPDVYLYGALYHVANYTGEQDKVVRWETCYQNAIADLVRHGQRLKYGGTPLVVTVAGENPPP